MNRKIFMRRLAAAALAGLVLSDTAWGEDVQKANPRFVIQGDTVYDKKSHLTWAHCSVGQHWKDGVGCEGTAKTFTFDDAQKLRSGGWRLPTGDELATLFDHARAESKQKLMMDEEEFPDMSLAKLAYWTRTPSSVGPDWGVEFSGGHVSQSKRIIAHPVRLVRGKQKS